jgi:hypothetical protein
MQRPNESFSSEFHPGDLKSTICMTGMSHLPEMGDISKTTQGWLGSGGDCQLLPLYRSTRTFTSHQNKGGDGNFS